MKLKLFFSTCFILLVILFSPGKAFAETPEEEKRILLEKKTSLTQQLKSKGNSGKQRVLIRKELNLMKKKLSKMHHISLKKRLQPVALSDSSHILASLIDLPVYPSLITGKASFYAEKFNGRKTASGAIFSNDFFTAAHLTLPFGTRVRVTSIQTKKSVDVVINDRGPYKEGRIIDLSKTAFAAIDQLSHGVIEVEIEILE